MNARTAPGPGATWYRLGDGTEVHVYGPPDEFHDFFGEIIGPDDLRPPARRRR